MYLILDNSVFIYYINNMIKYNENHIKTAYNNYIAWINYSLVDELIDILDKTSSISVIQNIELTRTNANYKYNS